MLIDNERETEGGGGPKWGGGGGEERETERELKSREEKRKYLRERDRERVSERAREREREGGRDFVYWSTFIRVPLLVLELSCTGEAKENVIKLTVEVNMCVIWTRINNTNTIPRNAYSLLFSTVFDLFLLLFFYSCTLVRN